MKEYIDAFIASEVIGEPTILYVASSYDKVNKEFKNIKLYNLPKGLLH